MRFRDLVCEHLAQYKTKDLAIREDGIFRYGGRDIPKSHILPLAYWKSNVLENYRAQFFSSDYADVRLHRFFHHLNSSQALCINLFYPLVAENVLDSFFKFLCIAPGTDDLPACFEKESDIEVAARRTSFDFCVQHAATCSVFVEVKYTEDSFGQATSDHEHKSKFRRTYLPLVEASLFLAPKCRNEAVFLSHYQLLRNLVHISATSHVVLLFPSANTVIRDEAFSARDDLLSDAGKARLRIVFLEEFVSFLEGQCLGGPLDGYYQTFRAKYLPAGAVSR